MIAFNAPSILVPDPIVDGELMSAEVEPVSSNTRLLLARASTEFDGTKPLLPLAPAVMITTDPKNILLRHFYQKSEEKLRHKRAAPDNLTPQNNGKQPRGPVADDGGSQASGRS
ncbi:hypothetical protein GUJ93_ZPchr0013g37151 [Zizania palustris]|uniref:DET1- and DDB1-associated protein 1 n=1 Tax=Zizania palustris TaxID=103762 RepID=A0A8J6BTE0_ZIZPA|nr:hypothetical protein GUJ93_ZPchr0013g37151 [Zizania palustris]